MATSSHSNFKVASVCHLVVILELWNMQYHANSISPVLLHTVWSFRENIEMWIYCFKYFGATLHFTLNGNHINNCTIYNCVCIVPVQGNLWFFASLISASIVLDLEPDHIYVWISTHFESRYCLKVETWGCCIGVLSVLAGARRRSVRTIPGWLPLCRPDIQWQLIFIKQQWII